MIDWFPDDNGNVHESNINKIADDGVTLGCGGGFYCPSANVSRDQMASFIGRALKLDPIFPDHFSPAWPSGSAISVTGASDISVSVDWSANPATDNFGIFEYDVYVDDVFDQSVGSTLASITGLSPSTSYTVRVEARDMSGQTTTGGPEVVAMTSSTADTEDPTWSSGAVMVTGTTGSSISVSWSGAMDNVGVNAYQVYVDGSPDQVVSAPTTNATIIGLSDSTSYTIRIEALDAAANESSDGPSVVGSTDDATDPFWSGGTIMVTGTTSTSISVSWSGASDNVGVTAYAIYVDEVFDKTVGGTSTTVTGLAANTSYTIRVEARDAAGNESNDGPEVTDSTDAGGGGQLITASNFSFSPDDVTVDNGTEVTFDNTGGIHSLIWESGSYPDESPASSGWTVVFTADAAGTFAYYCSVHGAAGGVDMSGTLTVDP